MTSIQRRRSIEPGTAFATWPPSHAAAVESTPSPSERPGGPLSSLKADYVVPPMSSVSVDPPIPAETDSRSAQDQHPMRANLPLLSQPLLSQPLLSTDVFHVHPPPNTRLPPQAVALQPPGHGTWTRPTLSTAAGGPTLLTLPPEIRWLIYQHIPYMTNRQPLIYCLSIFKDRKQHPLAAICRLVRAEALELYYSSNTWLVKLEYRDFYDSFVSWIRGLDDASANALRLLRVSVRGTLFSKPVIYGPEGYPVANRERGAYGYATFGVDLSEKFRHGKVEVLACDGPKSAGLEGRMILEGIVKPLWEKKARGEMRGVHVKEAMDSFLAFTGWWL